MTKRQFDEAATQPALAMQTAVMTDETSGPPAGWYPDNTPGMQRYWDGTAWTQHTAPLQTASAPPQSMRKQEKSAEREEAQRLKAAEREEAGRAKAAQREEGARAKAAQREEQAHAREEAREAAKAAATPDLREDIALAMSKMSYKMGSKREIRKLPEHLWEGETVQLLTGGTYGSGTGVVALTDRRLFFLKDGLMAKTSEDFPLDKISSVQWSTGMLLGKITVFASGNKAEIQNVQKLDGKAITDAIRARLVAASEPAASPAPLAVPPIAPVQTAAPQVEDPYERLRKLGELRDAGILTEEEFATKKQQILESGNF